MKCELLVATLFIGIFFSPHSDASGNFSSNSDWCDSEWRRLSGPYISSDAPNYSELEKGWAQYQGKCTDQVLFNSRMAAVRAKAGDIEGARAILRTIDQSKGDPKFGYVYGLSDLFVACLELGQTSAIGKEVVSEILKKADSIAERSPDVFEVNAVVGGVYSTFGDHEKALRHLRVAASLAPADTQLVTMASIFRNLTISYSESGQYEKAIEAADTAVSLWRKTINDEYFCLALARAQVGVKSFDDAEMTLRVLLSKNPEIRKNNEFQEIVSSLLKLR